MNDDVYFGDTARCRERQYAGQPDGFVDLLGLSVASTPDRVRVAPIDDVLFPLLFFPAEYADALALALVRAQLPYLLRREGFNPDTPWFVLASHLEDREAHEASRLALLLRIAFTEFDDGSSDAPPDPLTSADPPAKGS